MPDIAMCFGKGCPIKHSCYRHTATPTEKRQAYADFKFTSDEGKSGCTYYVNNGESCGICENCRKLDKVKEAVLRVVNPPFSHGDQGTVDLWNSELRRLLCIHKNK